MQASCYHCSRQRTPRIGLPPLRVGYGGQDTYRSIRYPDLTIGWGGPADRDDDLILSGPRVVMEVLSSSTRTIDLTVRKEECHAITGIDTIVFLDTKRRALAIHQRIGNGWTETSFSSSIDLAIPSRGVTIPYSETFARD